MNEKKFTGKKSGNEKPQSRTTNKKGRSRSSSSRRPRRTPETTNYVQSHNTALGSFTSAFSSPSHSIVFPESSLSMQALGNPVSCPGQDNFIENWNTIFNQGTPTGVPTISFTSPKTKRMPNAMRLDVCTYFGATGSFTDYGTISDPLQIAATNLKQFIDTSFGTVTSYDSQDLMLYLMAVSSVYPLIAEIKRDLRLALTYQEDVYPQFIPRGLFALLEITDGAGNSEHGEGAAYTAKQLRSWTDELNQIIFSFNKLPVPPEMALFRYNDDLWDCIYADSPDLRTAQLYIFRNTDYWVYVENNEPYPCLAHQRPSAEVTVGAKIERLRGVVDRLTALQTSSTAMLQNLYNAYGSKDLIKVETLENITPVEIRYDEKMLIAINNIAFVDPALTTITDIVANPINNRCEGHVYLDTSGVGGLRSAVQLPLQFHKDFSAVDKDDIGWAMRFHPSFRVWKTFTEYRDGGSQTTTALTADGYTGFAFVTQGVVTTLDDNGGFSYSRITPAETGWTWISSDFEYAPIPINATADGLALSVTAYLARRQVEVTYRLEDIRMFWVYLTALLYGSDLNRNFTGDRKSVV